jgi:hypothetical protein
METQDRHTKLALKWIDYNGLKASPKRVDSTKKQLSEQQLEMMLKQRNINL